MTFEIPRGDMEFTQELSDKYIGDVMPCWIKVKEHRGHLTDLEKQNMQELLTDLLGKYTRASLFRYGAPRFASGALAVDECIMDSEWDEGLEKKADNIRYELIQNTITKHLSDEHKMSLTNEMGKIYQKLDPCHHCNN